MIIKILRSHVCLCALTTSVFFFIHNIDIKAQDASSCHSLQSSLCGGSEVQGVVDGSYRDLVNTGSFDAVIIKKSENIALKMEKQADLKLGETLQLKKAGSIVSEVLAQPKMVTILDKVSITGNGKNTVNGKKGDSLGNGVSQAVFGVKQGGSLVVKDSQVEVTHVYGFVGESAPAVFANDRSSLELLNMSEVVVENSKITIKGHGARGLYFQGGLSDYEYLEGEVLARLGDFQFKKSTLQVPHGIAIYVDDARRVPVIRASEKSRIVADLLLEAKNHSAVGIEADASFLVGGTRVDSSSHAEFELSNGSQWTVTPRKKYKDSQSADSSLRFIKLTDSSIFFKKPEDGHYQTLHIGKLGESHSDDVYVAKGNARIVVNASLETRGQNKGIKADKILMYGGVDGTTKVHVVEVSGDSEKRKNLSKDEQRDSQSVSLIQVYGKATQDSFKLANGYVALRGAPYRYRLTAYGPSSSFGKAKEENRLVGQESIENYGDFWDFRLEAEYIQRSSQLKKKVVRRRVSRSIGTGSEDFVLYPDLGVRAVVPQVPTYLFLPNALFQAGLMDLNSQNKQVGVLRTILGGLSKKSENPPFFVWGYGGRHRYVSDLSALEYGFGGNLNYNAVEVGLPLSTVESMHHSTSFGIMGTYGKMSLQPQDVIQSKENTFDKWSVTAYGNIQQDTGFYLNGLLSYGVFKGDVMTLERGKTATLKGNPFNASFVGGKTFITEYKDLIFDPQVQVIYQNLQFDKTSDIDGFDIEMGKLHQWVMRVGGRLTKTLAASKAERVISFNGKLHFVHGFGGKQFVHFKDKFPLGAFGSSLEVGAGFNAKLSSKFALHGDINYQHRLTKAGFSGASFSAGLRYLF